MKNILILLFLSILNANPISPEDGSILNFIHVLFEWDQIPDASHYELEVADDINFSNIVFNKIDHSLCYRKKFYRLEQ
jgi:hypothetical protein